MDIQVWLIWMFVAAALIIGEIFTAGFFLLWFGIGAAVAGAMAYFGLGPVWQWGSFLVVSGALFAASRRFAERITGEQPPGIGADRFVGMTGLVIEEVDGDRNTGRVRVEKDEWRADSEEGDVIPVGEKVEVMRIEGVRLIVRRHQKETAEGGE